MTAWWLRISVEVTELRSSNAGAPSGSKRLAVALAADSCRRRDGLPVCGERCESICWSCSSVSLSFGCQVTVRGSFRDACSWDAGAGCTTFAGRHDSPRDAAQLSRG
jgi:hypothetical protein